MADNLLCCRLRDDATVCNIIDSLVLYLDNPRATSEEVCRVYLRKVESCYYKVSWLTSDNLNFKMPPKQRQHLLSKTDK